MANQREVPREYFLDEIRDGFFIPTMMKRSWAAMLSNYKALEGFCLQHGANCFVAWGSLLGAIRHGGFVPWDDDLDVAMMHEYFRRIKKNADAGELPGDHWIDDNETGNDENTKKRWMDTRSIVRDQEQSVSNYGFPFTNIIDIDVVDHIPDPGEERELFLKIVEVIVQIRDRVKTWQDSEDMTEEESAKEQAEIVAQIRHVSQITGYPFDFGSDRIVMQLLSMIDHYCVEAGYETADEATILPYFMANPAFIFPREYMMDVIPVDFEYDTVMVPVGYERVLRTCWSDYAVPYIDYGSHDYPYYRGMEADLKEKYGFEFATYHLYPDEYERVVQSRGEKSSLVETLQYSYDLLIEAHEYLEGCLREREDSRKSSNGDAENAMAKDLDEEFFRVLGECQNVAVSMGTLLEHRMLGYEPAVALLEAYCEEVYAAYQKGAEVSSEDIRELRTYENRLADELTEIQEARQVVFLCYRAEHWKSLHTIWEKEVAKEDTNVTVIPVPWYLRDFDGSINKDEMILETEGYPEEVVLTSYEDYDFEMNHPDEIIFQCPYDEYSTAMTVHPFFYASNLYQYTEQLVFIPPFYTRDIGPNDQRIRATLRDFVCNPGLIYADRILVQSEGVKQAYEEMLRGFVANELADEGVSDVDGQSDDVVPQKTERTGEGLGAGELPNGLWSEKIIAAGTAIQEWEARGRDLVRIRETGACYTLNARTQDQKKQPDSATNGATEQETRGGMETTPTIYDRITEIPEEWLGYIRREGGSLKKILVYYLGGSMLYDHGVAEVHRAKKLMQVMQAHGDDIAILWHMDKYAREILRKRRPETWREYAALKDWFVEQSIGIPDESGDTERAAFLGDAFFGDAGIVMNRIRSMGKPVMWATPGVPVGEDG